MATYADIWERSQDANVNAQIAVAITTEAKYALGAVAEPDTLAWATAALSNARGEATKYQIVICADPAVADAVEPTDENIQAAVAALVPTMVAGYKASQSVTPMIALPSKFRIKIYNGTGVELAANDVTVRVCFQKYNADAKIVESSMQTLYANAGSVANLAYDSGAWFENSIEHWISFHGPCYSNTTGAPNGTIRVFLENTTDASAGSTSPSDGRGWMLAEVAHSAPGASTRPIKV